MDTPISDSLHYIIPILVFATVMLIVLLGTSYAIMQSIKKPAERVFPLIILAAFAVGVALSVNHLLSVTSGQVASDSISTADERHEYLTGTVTSLELTGWRYEYIAHLTVRDEQGTEWRLATSLRNGLPVIPLKTGIRVRFPQYYFVTKSISLTRAEVDWKSYFDETKTGSPPLTFLKD